MDEIEIKIDEEGNLKSIYRDDLIGLYNELGTVNVSRASDVEYEGKGWTVRKHSDPEIALRLENDAIIVSRVGQLIYFTTREEALKEEVKHFWEIMGDVNG